MTFTYTEYAWCRKDAHPLQCLRSRQRSGVSRMGWVHLQWVAVFACLAFVATMFLHIVTPDWRFRRPLARFSLGGVQALLWVPIPLATGVLSDTVWVDGYVWFILWGMVGFAMQAMGFWLRVSHELTIQSATDKWILLSDRRYWELHHQSVDGLSGDGMMSVTHALIQIWQLAFAVHVLGSVHGYPMYAAFAIILLVLSVVCIGHSVLFLLAQLTMTRKGWGKALQHSQMLFAGCSLFTLGLTTGWLLVMSRVFP